MRKIPKTRLERTVEGLGNLKERLKLQADVSGYGMYLDDIDSAVKMLKDPDRVKVVRCEDCRFWIPNNAEEGDDSGKCHYGQCEGETTFSYFFCADGEADE